MNRVFSLTANQMINRIITLTALSLIGPFTQYSMALTGDSLDISQPYNGGDSSNAIYESIASGLIGTFNGLDTTSTSLLVGDSNSFSYSASSISVGQNNGGTESYNNALFGWGNSVSSMSDSLLVGNVNILEDGESNLVAGENNGVTGSYSFVFGRGLLSYNDPLSPSRMVVGNYNNAQRTGNMGAVFVVGNGSGVALANRRNAFEVYQTGEIKIPGGKISLFPTQTATTASIVIDPALSQITVGNRPVLTSGLDGSVGIGTTSPLAKLHVANNGYALFGPNSTWGQSLRIGGNGNVTVDASVAVTDGNLHLDSAPSNAMYLNYYKGTGGVNFGGGQGGTTGIVGSVSAAGNLTMNGKSVLRNNVKIFGSSESWAEGLTVIQSGGWGGIRLTRNDPATGNYEGNWALGYTGWGGNDFSISNSTSGIQHDAIVHISSSTQNVGVGTASPVSNLHVSGNAKSNSNVGQSGNSNLTVEARESGRTPGTGAAIGFVVPGNTDGSNRWEQGRILVTPDNANNGDANGRMYLQTRSYVSNSWIWRDNIILTSNGGVTIPKRQGDIVMGEFGNPYSGD